MTPQRLGVTSDRRGELTGQPSPFGDERYPPLAATGYPSRMPSQGGEWSSLGTYWRIIYRYKGVLLLLVLLSMGLGLLATRLQSPMYRARTLIEIEALNEDFMNMRNIVPTTAGGNNQPPEYNLRTQIAVLQSRPVLERMLQKQDLERRLTAGLPQPAHEQALAMAAAALKVKPQPSTRLIEVSFDSRNPQLAADMANSLTAAFSEITLESRWRSIQNTSEWLTRQLEDVKVKLRKSEDELQNYAHASDLTVLPGGESTTSDERLKQLQFELSKAQADRVEKQSKYEQASKAPVESLPEIVDNPTLRDYQAQLTTLRRQLADLSSSFTPSYPKVVSLRSQITAIEAALEKERGNILSRTKNEYESALRRENLVSKAYGGVIALTSREAEKVNHYSLLKSEVDDTRKLYDSMAQRVKEADLASAMKANDVHVIELARPPQVPYKPVAALNVGFGLLGGLGLGIVVVVQRARLNSNIQGPGDTVIDLCVPELGVIPAALTQNSFRRRLASSPAESVNNRIGSIQGGKVPSILTESFRLTLTSILLSCSDSTEAKVIAFSSAAAGEGKTTVTSNLGIALARFNRRVLLIDGDLRKRRLHKIFEVENDAGLYDALEGNTFPSVKETKLPNLYVLPSGKGVDGDLLFHTSKFHELLEKLKTEYDMILIDTPPLLQVADARLICSQADSTVLVIAQHTSRETAMLARKQLLDDRSHLLGTILNKWDPKTSLHGYRDYKSYYRSYYAES